MKIMAFPRDPNPYQRLLCAELERLGARVSYLGQLTPSHTLNLLLLPAEMAARRMGGTRLVHLHWVFGFGLPGTRMFPALRGVSQAWFGLWLWTARMLGLRLVWTAHNVLPHSQVFANDVAARRLLVRHCDLVLAHSTAALEGLAALGAAPGKSLVVRHGPMRPAAATALRVPGSDAGPREFLFFGKVAEYKGVEELLAAFANLQEGTPARLTVAGDCADADLRGRLAEAGNVRLRLEHVPERDLARLMAGADVVVLPFREVTTSGSAELALSHARPLIVPDLPALAGLPTGAVLRYDRSVRGLAAAIAELANADGSRLAAMSAAAAAYSEQVSWADIAIATLSAMKAVIGGAHETDMPPSAMPPSAAAAT
jgi:glycosyltransferase involved in cell wall biosynthesis